MTEKLESMYQLTKTFEQALTMVDEDWVLTEEAIELISKSEMDITQKTENIFKITRYLQAQVDMMKEEKKYIWTKQKYVENNIERIRKLFALWLDTVPVEVDKKWKKSQKIKTNKGSVYYTFKENYEYNTEEIPEKYKLKKKKIRLADNFTIEKLQKAAPELVEEIEYEEIDYELLKFDYERAIKNEDGWDFQDQEEAEVPKWIIQVESKTLNVRK